MNAIGKIDRKELVSRASAMVETASKAAEKSA
jgi:hypothetical protein